MIGKVDGRKAKNPGIDSLIFLPMKVFSLKGKVHSEKGESCSTNMVIVRYLRKLGESCTEEA